jgi:hypothetical protein
MRMRQVKKYLVLLDRDTGFHEVVEAKAPVEPVPFWCHVLPYTGTFKQVTRFVERLNRNPSLTAKYSVL